MVARSADAGELASWIHLTLVPGLGPGNFRALLSAFGLPRQILQSTHDQLARIVPARLARAIVDCSANQAAVDAILEWADKPGHHVVTLADEAYPQRLLHLSDPPPVLFLRGNPAWLSAPSIAVVGSRNATPGGVDNAERFSAALSSKGHTIVSGLALGIDAAAHRGGLSGKGSTVAVMGTGIDVIYPKRNEAIAKQIEETGALVTEFPPGTAPLPGNFPRRNRIIAGLSRGVLVVEAALASGSLITARLAAEIGRDVFAIPGSIHSTVSKGCHALIKQGAKLVESAEDVLEESASDRATPALPDHHLSGPEEALLQHMGYDPCSVDVICGRSGLTAETVSAMLLALEIDGRVAAVSGGLYQRLP